MVRRAEDDIDNDERRALCTSIHFFNIGSGRLFGKVVNLLHQWSKGARIEALQGLCLWAILECCTFTFITWASWW
ncbi:uncharacterized protein [Nicotiana sylvestris]|uniref:uncharacterized protein isoform X3 n=1 Tax=Nicotiana sylvestris TaxID=4096 RepID=UPI00388C3636